MNKLQKLFFRIIKKSLKNKLKKDYQLIPMMELTNKHVENSRLLNSRIELLKLLPKNGIVAELGVDQGFFSKEILNITFPSKLYLIDVWDNERYSDSKKEAVMEKFKDSISTGNVEIVIGYSTDVVTSFQNDYFDWIYIDTDHSYSNTIKELSLYGPKMKKDGIICGHDFIHGNFTGLLKYGVIEAVREFCLKENWEILYLTFDFNDNPSYAIRKLN
jgi:hypothetical protein